MLLLKTGRQALPGRMALAGSGAITQGEQLSTPYKRCLCGWHILVFMSKEALSNSVYLVVMPLIPVMNVGYINTRDGMKINYVYSYTLQSTDVYIKCTD